MQAGYSWGVSAGSPAPAGRGELFTFLRWKNLEAAPRWFRHDDRMDQTDVVPFQPDHADGVAALARAEGWPTFSDTDRVRRLFTAPGALGAIAVLRGRSWVRCTCSPTGTMDT